MIILPIYIMTLDLSILERLASPTYLVAQIRVSHSAIYRTELVRSRTLVRHFTSLPKQLRQQLFAAWIREIRQTHAKMEKKLPREPGLTKGPTYWTFMASATNAKTDVTKLDALLDACGRPTIFHTRSELRRIYQVKNSWEETFDPPIRTIKTPNGLRGSTGIGECWLPSFDAFYASECKVLFAWASRGLRGKMPPEMTFDLMMDKVQSAIEAKSKQKAIH